jgi:hypothetical protein
MTSQVDLCNLALDQIAARASITGLNPPSPANSLAAQVAARTYQLQADAVFRAAHWNSARKQATLTLLKAAIGTPENPSGALPTPPVPWRYEYGYPEDCLKVRFVIPQPNLAAGSVPLMTNVGVTTQPLVNTGLPFVPAVDTDSNGNQVKVILTNACMAQAVYTARIDNVDLWDPMLQNAVIGALGAWFCSPVNGSDERKKLAIATAAGLIQQARISDGNEGITSVDFIPDWMEVRNTGSSFWGLDIPGGGYMAGWDSWTGSDGVSY